MVDVRYVRSAFEAHKAGTADNWYLLWAVWVLERWAARQHDRPGVGLSDHALVAR